MWFEARRQEKKIRTIIVDHKRRAERRRSFYERIKKDPTEFLQLHGQACKVHLNSSQSQGAAAVLYPWQGDSTILIDRFDARSHLDSLPPTNTSPKFNANGENRRLNYERYRLLVINEFDKVSEEKFLKQIHDEERFGSVGCSSTKKDDQKKRQRHHVAIGYKYEDSTEEGENRYKQFLKLPKNDGARAESDDEDEECEQFDIRLDVNKLSSDDVHELNRIACRYGMKGNDFIRFINGDEEEREHLQGLKEIELQRATFMGKRGRLERRRLKHLHQGDRSAYDLPLGMLRKDEPKQAVNLSSEASSSDDDEDDDQNGAITYITSFGGTADKQPKKRKKLKRKGASLKKKTKDRSPTRPIRRTPTYGSSDSSSSYGRRRRRRRSRSPSTSNSSSASSSSGHRRRSGVSVDSDESKSTLSAKAGESPAAPAQLTDSDLSPLSIRSSMNDSEREQREVENTKRRLKRTKRELMSLKAGSSRPKTNQPPADGRTSKTQTRLTDKLKLQTQKALKKIAARDLHESKLKKEERRRERIDREAEFRHLIHQRNRRNFQPTDYERRERSPP